MSEQQPNVPVDPSLPGATAPTFPVSMPPPVAAPLLPPPLLPPPLYGVALPSPLAPVRAAGYAAPLPTTNTYAIVALVLAIMSFLLCPIVPAIFALVLAGTGKRQITASGGQQTGEGMVTAARVLSWLNIGLATLLVIIFVVIAVFLAGTASGVSSVITNLPTPGPVPTN
jgi:hypothetical protein